MSLASGSFWPKAAISPHLQVPAQVFLVQVLQAHQLLRSPPPPTVA